MSNYNNYIDDYADERGCRIGLEAYHHLPIDQAYALLGTIASTEFVKALKELKEHPNDKELEGKIWLEELKRKNK